MLKTYLANIGINMFMTVKETGLKEQEMTDMSPQEPTYMMSVLTIFPDGSLLTL